MDNKYQEALENLTLNLADVVYPSNLLKYKETLQELIDSHKKLKEKLEYQYGAKRFLRRKIKDLNLVLDMVCEKLIETEEYYYEFKDNKEDLIDKLLKESEGE